MGLRPLALRPFFLAILSGFLLTLAYPRWNLWGLAWIALVPLFYSLDESRNRAEAFGLGFVAGFVFYLLSISWLRHVTLFGLFFVVTVLAVYWGIFAVVFYGSVIASPPKADEAISRARDRLRNLGSEIASASLGSMPRNDLFCLLSLSAFWVVLEFIRSEVPVWSFGWNLLGNSQAPNLWVAQFASVVGVYGVSFLVFLGNGVLYSLLRGRARTKLGLFSTIFFFCLLGGTLLFGRNRIQKSPESPLFRVTVLQGNIPQLLKWEPAHKEEILRIYLNLTELASYDAPELIVWPEAAYPGFFNRELFAEQVKGRVRQIKIPLLVGSPHQEENGFYNSAYLLNPAGEVTARYDKIRLVPFGEYVPWKPIFGFLEPYAYALGVSDFSSGNDFTVFRAAESGPRFSVLVCFEDIFPELARQFVDRGADFLTVITNDAWFGHSSAPYQHLQASVFRAIESGVSIVRAANTGVSGFVTSRGQVVERVKNQEGKDTFVMGGMTYPVVWAKEETIYRRGGWLFPYVCFAIWLISVIKRGQATFL